MSKTTKTRPPVFFLFKLSPFPRTISLFEGKMVQPLGPAEFDISFFENLQSRLQTTMDFLAKDPGCVKHGNFINYYSFNPAESRIQLLPPHIWRTSTTTPYIALDVGCNSGDLTQLLYKFLVEQVTGDVHILGIDLDPILIQRAQESNKYPDHVSYACANVVDDKQTALEGFLRNHGKSKFDTVFCFSITMWIHLNEGDNGLKEFLRKCVNVSQLLVIEPQPWRCYQTAVKRLKKGNEVFPQFQHLKWKQNVENDIQTYLEAHLGQRKVFETQPTKWKRKICLYEDE